jgi:disulfide bond formation protein DsbB
MFPLVILFAVGFVKKDKNCLQYTSPLIVAGLAISAYHNLLYYDLIEKSITACSSGLSCTSKQIEWFGFVSIPLLSLMAFSLLTLLFIYSLFKKKESL